MDTVPESENLSRGASRRIAARQASPEGCEGLGSFSSKQPPAWRHTEGR